MARSKYLSVAFSGYHKLNPHKSQVFLNYLLRFIQEQQLLVIIRRKTICFHHWIPRRKLLPLKILYDCVKLTGDMLVWVTLKSWLLRFNYTKLSDDNKCLSVGVLLPFAASLHMYRSLPHESNHYSPFAVKEINELYFIGIIYLATILCRIEYIKQKFTCESRKATYDSSRCLEHTSLNSVL